MKPVLLIVDDSEDILEFLEIQLRDKYEIIKAFDGAEALEKLAQATVQLIVSDIMMPVMDGLEFCRAVKSDVIYSHIPLVLLTAKNTMKSKIAGLEIGADAYIEKPFSPEHLKVQIANLLANRAKIKQHFASTPLVNIKTIAFSKTDELFLDKLYQAICSNMDDQDLDVDKLAKLVNMSRSSLYRMIKSISDLAPNEFINITRLKKAAELLSTGKYKIYEVSELTGFGYQTNFGRNFLKQFGMTPSDYMTMKQEENKNQ